jgi:hypothetical protein
MGTATAKTAGTAKAKRRNCKGTKRRNCKSKKAELQEQNNGTVRSAPAVAGPPLGLCRSALFAFAVPPCSPLQFRLFVPLLFRLFAPAVPAFLLLQFPPFLPLPFPRYATAV